MILWEMIRERVKGVPWGMIIVTYIIIGLGLANLYSATSADISPLRFNDQIKWIVIGTFLLFFWGLILDIRSIEKWSLFGYIVVCALLFAVDIKGEVVKGSQRWLDLKFFRLQPSELAKFIIILIIARSFSMMKGVTEFNLFTLWRQFLFLVVPLLLILAQPDLGTGSLVFMIAAAQILFVRIELKSIAIACFLGVTTLTLSWNFAFLDYQKQRVLSLLNPMTDPKGIDYQRVQSMIAVGSGGLLGRGFQQGTQAQLSFLPERHTDFIFSVFAEEHGFVGCVVMFTLYMILIGQMFQIAERAKDTFSSLVSLGVTFFFLFHFIVNVTMVLGLFPVVGVPLSLLSYGGSHMLTALSCLGLLVAVERRRIVAVS